MSTVEQGRGSFDWAGVVDYAARYTHEAPQTQYELPGVTEELHQVACPAGGDHHGVPVAVVPLWHAMVTARLNLPAGDTGALGAAQRRLDVALAEIERLYPLSPAGLLPQVAWGLPYFARYLPPSLVDEILPKSTREGSEGEVALLDAIAFPRDPDDLVVEHNDVCFHFKSDFRHHVDEAIAALFSPGESILNGIAAENAFIGDLVTVTSIRRGFAGRGMPRRVGTALGIPGLAVAQL